MLKPFTLDKHPLSGVVFTNEPILWARRILEGEVVLDLDDGLAPPADWPDTRCLVTPRGWHMHYRSESAFRKISVQVNGRKVDVCPAGTMEFIAGPGRHLINTPMAELPGWLVDALAHHGPATRGVASERRDGAIPYSYLKAAEHNLFKLVAQAAEGTRTIKLNSAAYRLGELGYPFEKTLGSLRRASARCGLVTDPGTNLDAVIKCGWNAGTAASRGTGTTPP